MPLLAVLLAALLIASPAAAQAPAVHDSAGITIVENDPPKPGAPAPVLIAARPALQIGAEDAGPNYQFDDIVAALRLSDGSIAVADRGSEEIRIFSAAGRFMRKVGRQGRGPGEFQQLSRLSRLAGDSLLAWDAANGRFTLFGPRGKVIRTFTARRDTADAASAPVPVRSVAPDGSFFGYRVARQPPPQEETIVRDTLSVALYSRAGAYVATVGRFLGLQRLLDAGGTMRSPLTGKMVSAFSMEAVPFAHTTVLEAGVRWLYAGDGGTAYDIAAYDRTGRLKRIIRVRRDVQRVTHDVIARFRAQPQGRISLAHLTPNPNIAEEFIPKTVPAYSAFRIDGAHRLWVKDYPLPGEKKSRWNVFGSNGRILGTVVTPSGVEVLEIGTTYLIGIWRDALDVEYVRLYHLHEMAFVNEP